MISCSQIPNYTEAIKVKRIALKFDTQEQMSGFLLVAKQVLLVVECRFTFILAGDVVEDLPVRLGHRGPTTLQEFTSDAYAKIFYSTSLTRVCRYIARPLPAEDFAQNVALAERLCVFAL